MASAEYTMKLIAGRSEKLWALQNKLSFSTFTAQERLELLQQARNLINDVSAACVQFANSTEWSEVFNDSYNEIRQKVKQFINIPRSPSRLTQREMNNLRAEFVEKVSVYSDWQYRTVEQQVELWNEISDNIDDQVLRGFQPRQVLFSVPRNTEFVENETALKAFRQKFLQARREIQRVLNNTIDAGWSSAEIHARLRRNFNRVYPDGAIPVRYRRAVLDDQGNFVKDIVETRYYNTGKYLDTWIRDWHTMSDSKGQVAGAISAGLDLVKITGGDKKCEICGAYYNQVFSLTGKTKGFPVLKRLPPFHPNCTCYIVVLMPDEAEKYINRLELRHLTFGDEITIQGQNLKVIPTEIESPYKACKFLNNEVIVFENDNERKTYIKDNDYRRQYLTHLINNGTIINDNITIGNNEIQFNSLREDGQLNRNTLENILNNIANVNPDFIKGIKITEFPRFDWQYNAETKKTAVFGGETFLNSREIYMYKHPHNKNIYDSIYHEIGHVIYNYNFSRLNLDLSQEEYFCNSIESLINKDYINAKNIMLKGKIEEDKINLIIETFHLF